MQGVKEAEIRGEDREAFVSLFILHLVSYSNLSNTGIVVVVNNMNTFRNRMYLTLNTNVRTVSDWHVWEGCTRRYIFLQKYLSSLAIICSQSTQLYQDYMKKLDTVM